MLLGASPVCGVVVGSVDFQQLRTRKKAESI
jgi:hypothetical protein